MIKLLSKQNYERLSIAETYYLKLKEIFAENLSDSQLQEKISYIVLLQELIGEVEQLFNVSKNDYSEEAFHSNLNAFSLIVSNKLKYDFVVFGYRYENTLVDLTSFYKQTEINNSNVSDLKTINYQNSLVGRIIDEMDDPFIWTTENDGDIFNYDHFISKYRSFDIDRRTHKNIERFFSFLGKTKLTNLIICPISTIESQKHRPLGYFILANKQSPLTLPFEIELFRSLKSYLSQIFKNQTRIFTQDRDSNLISDIFKKHFVNGIQDILRYVTSEFSFKYTSFWVPTLEEARKAFGLNKSYSDELDKHELAICNQYDFYLEKDCILGKINTQDLQPVSPELNIYSLESPNSENTGFKSLNKELVADRIYFKPIFKYYNTEAEKIEDRLLGIFCFYQKSRDTLDESTLKRLNELFDELSFYIEHIIYDASFHSIKDLSRELLSIDITDIQNYYDRIAVTITALMHAEQTSIFFATHDNELYLRASTASEFRKVDKISKEIIETYEKEVYVNNSLTPIYKDDSSLTYRSYRDKTTYIIHDLHDPTIKTNCSFCESTLSYSTTIIVSPIIVDSKCVGVIRCVNKKQYGDAFLKTFTKFDKDILHLISSFISYQHLKIKTAENQQLFVEKLAHENKTPVQIIWSAIENIEIKLSRLSYDKSLGIEKNFQNIIFATSVLNNNYTNLNTYLRSKEDKLNYSYDKVDLRSKIEEITTILQPYLEKESNKNIAISHNIHHMPNLKIDEVKMVQVIYNLLTNAVRYSDNSTTISTYYKPNQIVTIKGKQTECFEIKFCNFGIGIDKADVEKIFKEYYRGENAISVNPNGTGIGLHVAKTIIEGHGGLIQVTELNNPTTFSIYLPIELIIKQ